MNQGRLGISQSIGIGFGLVLTLALFTRLALIVPALNQPPDDPDNYLPLARTLAEGRGFLINGHPSAYRPPLYPVVLAPLAKILSKDRLFWGVAALHLAIGLGTVGLTFQTARWWGLNHRRALLASAIVAIDPVLVVQSRSVMTETLAAMLLVASLAGLAWPGRAGPWLGGLALGLGGLCRPSLLPAAILASLAALLVGPGRFRVRLVRALGLLAATLLVLAPWAIRNAIVLGEPVWTTTHGGYTLALANNPVYYDEVLYGPPGAVWSGPNQQAWFERVNALTAGMTEPEADRFLSRMGWRMFWEQPGSFVVASLARLGRFWGLAPSGAVYPPWLRWGTAAWTFPLWVAMVWGLRRRGLWQWPAIAGPIALLALSAVHTFYWTDLRMRAPIVPAIALIAAGAGVQTAREPESAARLKPEAVTQAG